MKKLKSFVALLGAMGMVASLGVGCGNDGTNQPTETAKEVTASASGENTATEAKDIKEFSMYIAMPGTEIPTDNRVYNKIAEKIGAKAKITWLTGQTAKESIGTMVAGGDYTDFVVGSDGTSLLIDAGALLPIDEYWDKYPNIKNYLSESDWNKVRSEDGHIYLIPQFGVVNGKDTQTYHNDEAFWIQIRVLEWAGYPTIKTVDEYFDLIAKYKEANPTMEGGLENIGFEMICDDWRYYSLENPPMFLAGYPNDGCCIVDPETLTAYNYNTTDIAKRYFNKLNEEYKKGIIDPECFTLNYDQYIAKISTGRVLGLVDQYWNFQTAEQSIETQGLYDNAYVPLPLVMDEGTEPKWHSGYSLDVSNGLSITTSCKDPEGAFQMIEDMLSQEMQTLVWWGEEGIDYMVGDDGVFYRTEEQRAKALDKEYLINELCNSGYSYFPHYVGMNLDGINAYAPNFQPGEYYDGQSEAKKKVMDAYGYKTFAEFVNEAGENSDWYPMWSYSNTWTADTDYGLAKVNMDEVKHEWLPKVIMSDDFQGAWDQYMSVLGERVDMKVYEDALTAEVRRRVDVAQGK